MSDLHLLFNATQDSNYPSFKFYTQKFGCMPFEIDIKDALDFCLIAKNVLPECNILSEIKNVKDGKIIHRRTLAQLKSDEKVLIFFTYEDDDDEMDEIFGEFKSTLCLEDDLDGDLINRCFVTILYQESSSAEVLKLCNKMLKYRYKSDKKNRINLICDQSGLYLKEFPIKDTKLDIALNYNDDFLPIHKKMVEKLNDKSHSNGLILLHGDPGTGKSHYLRHLVTQITDKKVMYIPPDLTSQISSPQFLSFIMDYRNSILVIEDCENVLYKRDGSSNQATANILNLADGLLADILSINIVCTFNTEIEQIDNALLRKGRLISRYKFTKLEKSKAQRLSDSLGFKNVVSNDMALSDIYNQDDDIGQVKAEARGKFGF